MSTERLRSSASTRAPNVPFSAGLSSGHEMSGLPSLLAGDVSVEDVVEVMIARVVDSGIPVI